MAKTGASARSDATLANQATIDALITGMLNTEYTIKLPSAAGVDAIAAAGDQTLTERTIVVPATPAGYTLQRVMVACLLTIINKSDTAHQIDIDQNARLGAGGWTTYFTVDDYLGFPATTNAMAADVPLSDVSALVVGAGSYGFRLTVNQSGGANNVRYKTQYVLFITYRLT